MTDKPKVTRTFGPIHFEDLDPHRFEDLIRELIYDYKDWQSIEATGRSGSDDGFDIRAYEKREITTQDENENNDETEVIHPMEGNLWMIQVKREKEIGPKKIETIIAEIDSNNPPYGYILAAAANFSKESYDVFRDELRQKGVMEYYLWGKAELEDMLHQPKNDRILFTFFGISLVSRRRSRSTEIKSVISVKNKLFRLLGEGNNFYKEILLRDLKDTSYPYKNKYRDFANKPRWKIYTAFSNHPLGIFCHIRRYFAFIDFEKKEWDYYDFYDLVRDDHENDDERIKRSEVHDKVFSVWESLPRKNKGYFLIDGLIKYEDIAAIDEKGDLLNYYPHIYVDFDNRKGPFAGNLERLNVGEKEEVLGDEFKRIKIFAEKVGKLNIGKLYKAKKIVLSAESYKEFKEFRMDTIFEADGKYDFLKPGDVIQVENKDGDKEEIYIQITYKTKIKVDEYLVNLPDYGRVRRSIKPQLGRDYSTEEELFIYEFKRYYDPQAKKKK
jgi:hypothetical protein